MIVSRKSKFHGRLKGEIIMKYIVKDSDGKDVTTERNWYIDSDGNLYFETDDVDCPLMDTDEYSYELIIG